jgi:ABC-type sugar transport system permease subunit
LAASPAIALLVLFLAVPVVDGVRLSFSSWGGTGPMAWVGLANYRALSSNGFGSALVLTVKYSLLCTAGVMVLASLMAAAISSGVRGARFYRVIWFLPGIAPIAAVSVFWSLAFQPTSGIMDAVLGHIGLGSTHAWLASANYAIYPTVFVTVWASVGFAFLVLLGAMEQIPVSLTEAARIDGASWMRVFRSVTLPLIRPVMGVIALLEVIWTFNGFTTIWGMTQGGPGYATSTVPVLVYQEAFRETNFGLASSMAVIGGLILVVLGAVMLRVSRSRQGALT